MSSQIPNYQHLRKELPARVFKPYPLRILTLSIVIVSWMVAVTAIITVPMALYYKFALSLVIGVAWGMSGLLAHELLHGSIVRNKKVQNFFGFLALLPYMISPTFWRYWHNNLHHSHTQKIALDPDAYPTHRLFKHSKFAQWMFPVSPGSGHKRSYLYFFFWFSVNVMVAQFYFRFRNKAYAKLNHTRVNIEAAMAVVIMFSMLAWAGPSNWIWVFLLPFAIKNYYSFSYISTNHNLSPLTKHNDPLANSLTVTNHPILEALHFNFGYHVEHHMFPTASPKFIKPIHELLKVKYPDRYQYMPKWQAIRALYATSRIYKDTKTLMNPKTNITYPTLGPVIQTKNSGTANTTSIPAQSPIVAKMSPAVTNAELR